MSQKNDTTLPKVALTVVSVFVILYSLLITQRPLLGVVVVLVLFGAYLAWRFFHLAVRFVVAVERIADSLETQSSDRERRF